MTRSRNRISAPKTDDSTDVLRATLHEQARNLPVKQRNKLIFDLLEEAGATGIVIPGENGEIEGFVADRTIALKYLKNKSWSVEKIWFAEAAFRANGGGCLLDLGANIGTMTIPLARLEGVSVWAVEPDPENFALLQRNLMRNGVTDRVTAINKAIYTEQSVLGFEKAPNNLGDHRLLAGAHQGENLYHEESRIAIEVAADRLDALIPAQHLTGFVLTKMDIQGAEPFAFESGPLVFAATDWLMLEYWPYGIQRLGHMLETFHQQFRHHFSYGAVIADDQDPQTVKLEPVDVLIDRLSEVGSEKAIEAIDLVLGRSGDLPFD